MSKLQNSNNQNQAESSTEFVNAEFQGLVSSIRQTLPQLAKYTIIGAYVIAIFAEGVLLYKTLHSFFLAEGAFGALYLFQATALIIFSLAISSGLQVTRAELVFFPQMNPGRLTIGRRSEVTAVAMGLVAIASVIFHGHHLGFPVAAVFSICALMGSATWLEVDFIGEVKFSTKKSIASDENYLKSLALDAMAVKKIDAEMRAIAKYKYKPDVAALFASLEADSKQEGNVQQAHPDAAYDLSQKPMAKEFYSSNGNGRN